MAFLLIGSFGAAGILLPQMWLNQRVSHRQNLIIKSLPDAFDLITTCVEAGLGLDAALSRVAEKVGTMAQLNRLRSAETVFGVEAAGRLMTEVVAAWVQDLGLLVESVEAGRPPGAPSDWQPGAVVPSSRLARTLCG